MQSTTPAGGLLHYLREEGLEVTTDGDQLVVSPASKLDADLRNRIREAKPDLIAALDRERVERVLDLVPVDPETGLPELPVDEPATERQRRRLRELADRPEWGDHREDVQEIVEEAISDGISQLGAWGLIRELGGRIHDRREERA